MQENTKGYVRGYLYGGHSPLKKNNVHNLMARKFEILFKAERCTCILKNLLSLSLKMLKPFTSFKSLGVSFHALIKQILLKTKCLLYKQIIILCSKDGGITVSGYNLTFDCSRNKH